MNKKVWTSLLVIGLAFLAIGGGTLAWFTAQANIVPNVFKAGTLELGADEVIGWEGDVRENWNPGDCDKKRVYIIVTGSKNAYLRTKLIDGWYKKDGNDWLPWDLKDAADNQLDDPVEIIDIYGYPWSREERWVKIGEWYYHHRYGGTAIVVPNEVIYIIGQVCLSGEAGNEFQGKQYRIGFDFEAIQTTHEAAFAEWGVGYVNGTWVEVEFNVETDRWETKVGSYCWDGTEWLEIVD